ncbi:MAG TPA: hypothetical protein VGI45_15310 [Terracidiphilus sp.]|jgi:hypothetical protein
MNHCRRIAAILVAIVLGAGDVFAQQTNIHNVPSQQVDPTVLDLPITGSTVSDIHLRPLFTTTIRLPEPVTSVAVGAPTLFKVEHSTDDPRLVFIKPTSADAAVSNLIIALKSGQEISIRLLSNGQASTAPVDFVVNYEPRQSFLIGSTDALAGNTAAPSDPPKQAKPIDVALREEEDLASPQWVNGKEKQPRNGGGAASTEPILVALGTVQDHGERMLVAYSVLNTSGHWIEVLPPQVELRSPDHHAGKKKKQKQTLADQVPVAEFRLSARRLAPGQRADGAVEFSRPGFKQSVDRLVLEIATASAVDHPLLRQLPFVAPGE